MANCTLEISYTLSEPGSAQVAGSAFFLIFISVIGTIGNILILYAVISQKALRRVKGNYFVCNLALADLTVTAVVLPATAGNVILNNETGILPNGACRFVAFLMPFTCVVSMLNLMLIGVQRFLGITSMGQLDKKVEKRIALVLVALSWVWAAMMVLPMLVKDPNCPDGFLYYDRAAAMCAWNDRMSPRFTLSVVLVSFFIPLSVTALCYYELFSSVSRKSKEMTRRMDRTNQAIETREKKLLGTIFIVLIAFLVSWGPYCLLLTFDSLEITDVSTNEYYKRPSAWMGCTNSAVNSIIYGWRNQNFRHGYIECAYKLADLATFQKLGFYSRYSQKRLQRRMKRLSQPRHMTSTVRTNATVRTIANKPPSP